MTLAGYTASGGVAGAIAQTADAVFGALEAEEQALARSIFLRLTELGEEGSQDTRRRVAPGELVRSEEEAPEVESLLRTLADARLVTTGEDTVEVAHEAMLREWSRLRGWLDGSRAGVRMQRLLAVAAQEWTEAGRDPSFLLRGARLAQFQGWAQEGEIALTRGEEVYLTASIADRQEREAREAERQRRELDTARKLAEVERQRAEEHASAALSLRKRAGYLAVALAVARHRSHRRRNSRQRCRRCCRRFVMRGPVHSRGHTLLPLH